MDIKNKKQIIFNYWNKNPMKMNPIIASYTLKQRQRAAKIAARIKWGGTAALGTGVIGMLGMYGAPYMSAGITGTPENYAYGQRQQQTDPYAARNYRGGI